VRIIRPQFIFRMREIAQLAARTATGIQHVLTPSELIL
jgi:hypothetical protein